MTNSNIFNRRTFLKTAAVGLLGLSGCINEEAEKNKQAQIEKQKKDYNTQLKQEFDQRFAESEKPYVITVTEKDLGKKLEVKRLKDVYDHGIDVNDVESYLVLKGKNESGNIVSVYVLDDDVAKKEGLAALIDGGTKISFPRGNIVNSNAYEGLVNFRSPNDYYAYGNTFGYFMISRESDFTKGTQTGQKYASRIKVLNGKAEKEDSNNPHLTPEKGANYSGSREAGPMGK